MTAAEALEAERASWARLNDRERELVERCKRG